MFQVNFIENLCFSIAISLIFVVMIRNFIMALINTSEFSGDMQNFYSENDNLLDIRNCHVCKTPKSKRIHHCTLCEKYQYLKFIKFILNFLDA